MTQPGKDGVAQWGGAALPDLIEAMAGRSRQLWLRLVIGVLIAGIVAFQLFPLELVGKDFDTAAKWIGGGVFVLVILALYRYAEALSKRAGA